MVNNAKQQIYDLQGSTTLGQCNNFNLKGLEKVQLQLDSTDGWFGNYIKIHLDSGIVYRCPMNQWIDNYSNLDLSCTLLDD